MRSKTTFSFVMTLNFDATRSRNHREMTVLAEADCVRYCRILEDKRLDIGGFVVCVANGRAVVEQFRTDLAVRKG